MKLGLLGHNIGYSKSPQIFAAIFEELGIKGEFQSFDIPQKKFDSFAKSIGQHDLNGLAVTIPYKQSVLNYLSEVDAIAEGLQAVNSIKFDNGRSIGTNTDVIGFSLALEPFRSHVEGKSALILGAGGAARATACALGLNYSVPALHFLGRDLERVEKTIGRLRDIIPAVQMDSGHISNSIAPPLSENSGIIVNCTPMGGPNNPNESPGWNWSSFPPEIVYFDTNYNRENKMILQAREAGLKTVDGSTMLVGQAIRSFEIWTGQSVNVEVVHERVFGVV